MLQIERIEQWRGQEVLDPEGEKIGKLEEVFYDSTSGEARFISVAGGRFGRHSYLVALVDATVGPDYVRVGFPASRVEAVDASTSDGQLDPETVRTATEYYGIPIVVDASFESATLLAERRAQAAQARAAAREQEAAGPSDGG
jgi:sporulation protein YlmC with PRC-barrel domain